MAVGCTPAGKDAAGESSRPARANARRGWSQMTSVPRKLASAAKGPATTTRAADWKASSRNRASSTNSRSVTPAAAGVAMPETRAPGSPITRPLASPAISAAVRVTAAPPRLA